MNQILANTCYLVGHIRMIVSIGFKTIGMRELNTSPESSDSRTSPVTAPPLATCRGQLNRTKFASLVHLQAPQHPTPHPLPRLFGINKPAALWHLHRAALPLASALRYPTSAPAPRCPAPGINTSLPYHGHRHSSSHPLVATASKIPAGHTVITACVNIEIHYHIM